MTVRSETDRQGGDDGLGRLSGPPLIVQFIGLVIGALIAAQLVTLLLTLVMPPPPPREYALADIAAALRGADVSDARFDRVVQSGPPDLSARGWFVSETSRAKLAGLLGRPLEQVALGFYTQLPVGGTVDPVAAPKTLPSDAERARSARIGAARGARPAEPLVPASMEVDPTPAIALGNDDGAGFPALALFEDGPRPRLMHAALFQQQPGGGFPGGAPPGGGFPGGGFPGGGFPQSQPRPQPQSQPQSRREEPQPQRTTSPPDESQEQERVPQPSASPEVPAPSASPAPSERGGNTPSDRQDPASARPADAAQPASGGQADRAGAPAAGSAQPPSATLRLPPEPPPGRLPATTRRDESTPPVAGEAERNVPAAPPLATTDATVAPGATGANVREPGEGAPNADPSPAVAPIPVGRPVPIERPAPSLFGLAPAPFVEGDFVAGVRSADGRWTVVSPRAEGFPNAWQRRVALWFLLSLLAVAPIAWLFARRIVGPLNDFAHAADVLGRDPGAAVLPLDGPAEIGRAAHAFNQMQSRLRSFVDDRTAMIGAISHDLRTPLTRLRFRIEDVPEEQQDDLRAEVAEMEEMITSVITFMRDAATPAARERRDLAEIVDDVILDATLLGAVEAGRVDSAIVDVDPLGIRRVLDNLLTNAIKYGGGHARVALHVENACAVADIVDDGPGVPDGELERIFEPFYRSEAARQSGREGSGLGLAVCRSIARAHGGDVALFSSPVGFTARVTLPLAFTDDRRVA